MLQSAVGVAASASRVREDEILAIEPSDELTMVLEAKVDFILRDRRTLSFNKKDIIACDIERSAPAGWAHGRMGKRAGLFPLSYTAALQLLPPASVDSPNRRRRRGVSSAFVDTMQGITGGQPDLPLINTNGTVRQCIWRFLDVADSSRLALVWSVVVMGLIVFSVVSFVIQTLDVFWKDGKIKYGSMWDAQEAFVTFVFTAEYTLRIATTPEHRCRFIVAPLNVVDLAAILPYWLQLLVSLLGMDAATGSWLRVLRLARVFRILKLGKYSSGLQLFGRAMFASIHALSVQAMLMSLTIVFSAALLYFCEQGEWDARQKLWLLEDGDPTPFDSIPATAWWAMATITTVGYGDVSPATTAGKLVATLTMCVGVLSISVPVAVIAASFQEEYASMQQQKEVEQEKRSSRVIGDALQNSSAGRESSVGGGGVSSSTNKSGLGSTLAKFRGDYVALRGVLMSMHLMMARVQTHAVRAHGMLNKSTRRTGKVIAACVAFQGGSMGGSSRASRGRGSSLLTKGGKTFSELESAAIRVQTIWRGRLARKQVQSSLREPSAAAKKREPPPPPPPPPPTTPVTPARPTLPREAGVRAASFSRAGGDPTLRPGLSPLGLPVLANRRRYEEAEQEMARLNASPRSSPRGPRSSKSPSFSKK